MRWKAISLLWLMASISTGADKHVEPVLIDARLPHYPRIAEAAHITGEVRAEFRVSADGEVSDIKTTGNPILQAETQKDIQSWKFSQRSAEKNSLTLKTTFVYGFAERCVDDVLKDQTVTITLKSFRYIEIQIVPQCPQPNTSRVK